MGVETNISKEYNELLNNSDLSSTNEDNPTLTDNDIDSITNTIESEISPDVKRLRKIQETEHHEENQSDMIKCIIDPATGNMLPTNEDDQLNYINDSFDDLIKSWENEKQSFKDIDITEDIVAKSIKSNIDMKDLSDDTIKELIDLSIRYKNGEEFPFYKSMPDQIKKYIDQAVFTSSVDMGKFAGNGRNYLAKTLLDNILMDSAVETAYVDVTKSIENLDSVFSYSSFIDKLIQTFEVRYLEDAEKLDAVGTEDASNKAAQLRELSNAFTQSYTYTEMLEKYKLGKIRVKKIQVEKFDRACREFNQKYQSSKLVINNIQTVIPVLDRHVDKSIDLNILKEFICVFINYTQNMSPDNISEHIFMYFFIKNILGLDYYKKSGKDADNEFSDNLVKNINEFLYAIIERKNDKKGR